MHPLHVSNILSFSSTAGLTLPSRLGHLFSSRNHQNKLDQVLLAANDPNFTASSSSSRTNSSALQQVVNQTQANTFYEKQFLKIQAQTKMNKHTLYFHQGQDEDLYKNQVQHASVARVQRCIGILFFALTVLFLYENHISEYEGDDKTRLTFLTLYLTLPVVFIGFLLTSIKSFKVYKHLEHLSFGIFFFVALIFIIKKPLQKEKGAILPLQLLFIPIFNVTRMRFIKSACLGWLIVLLYASVQLYFVQRLQEKKMSIMYQCVNYAITTIGGCVSCYRQELLRRRNFAMTLPFHDHDTRGEEDIPTLLIPTGSSMNNHKNMQEAMYLVSHQLLNKWTLVFHNHQVETMFFRFWYLFDSFPFANPNASIYHLQVYRVVRFAVIEVLLNQTVLTLQDLNFCLRNQPTKISFDWMVIGRLGIVVPCYVSIFFVLAFFGKRFYTKWTTHNNKKNKGYTLCTQLYTSCMVIVHIVVMGSILYYVSRQNLQTPTYYMGFLNAIVYGHRSGFRLGFRFATCATLCGIGIFIVGCFVYELTRQKIIEYSIYASVMFCMGMMISYEEEKMRRLFFIYRSIRLLEFEKWYTETKSIDKWIQKQLKQKMSHASFSLHKKKTYNSNNRYSINREVSTSDSNNSIKPKGEGQDQAAAAAAGPLSSSSSSSSIVVAARSSSLINSQRQVAVNIDTEEAPHTLIHPPPRISSISSISSIQKDIPESPDGPPVLGHDDEDETEEKEKEKEEIIVSISPHLTHATKMGLYAQLGNFFLVCGDLLSKFFYNS